MHFKTVKNINRTMKTIARLLSLVTLMLALATSCSSNSDSDTITEQAFPGFFANIEELTTGATAVYNNVSYSVRLNYTAQTADVQISGLRLPDGTSYPTMTLSGMRWIIDRDGWKVISASNITPAISGISNLPKFNSFEFRIYERFLEINQQSVYSPGVCARYTVNSIYNVLSSDTPQILYGETDVETVGGSDYESKAVEYVVAYNPDTRMLSLQMNGFRFRPGSAVGYDLELRNIPVTVQNGAMYFYAESIIPYLENTPFEACTFTNLRGEFNPGDGLEFTFNCTPRNDTESYIVDVDCDYSQTQPLY